MGHELRHLLPYQPPDCSTDGLWLTPQVRAAFGELAIAACEGIPGCSGSGISLLRSSGTMTLVSTEHRVWEVDQAQYRSGYGPCLTALITGEPVLADLGVAEQRWPEIAETMALFGFHGALSVPMVAGGQPEAALNLYASHSFSTDDLRIAQALARQGTLLLQNAHLLHFERLERKREQQIAEALQRSLMPTLPALPGLRCAGRYVVAGESAWIGGDWYDVFPLPDGAVGIAVGDAMGHDLAAAAAMGKLRTILRSSAYGTTSPARVLKHVDRLVQDFAITQVATVVYMRLVRRPHTHGGRLAYANAGHPPPLLVEPEGRVVVLKQGRSPLIGAASPDATARNSSHLMLPSGSTLVLCTDGLIEQRGRTFEQGMSALVQATCEYGKADPDGLCDALLDRLIMTEPYDDVALLAVQLVT